MKLLILSAVALVGTVFTMVNDSAVTTKRYTMHALGNQGGVTLNWKNIRGFGQLSGTIGGNPVVGKNYSSGKLTLLCEDIYMELSKVRDGSRFQWQGRGYNGKDCTDFEVILVPENHGPVSEDVFTTSGERAKPDIMSSSF